MLELLLNYKDDIEYIKKYFRYTDKILYLEKSKILYTDIDVNLLNIESETESKSLMEKYISNMKYVFIDYKPKKEKKRRKNQKRK